LLLPAGVYYAAVLGLTWDMPFFDDYPGILKFLNRYLQASGWDERLALLFHRHNEHCILVTRLVALLQYSIVGRVSFVQITLLGNLFNAGIFLFLVLMIRRQAGRAAAATPVWLVLAVGFVLFNFSYFSILGMALTSVANLSVCFFAVACCYFLTAPDRFWPALLCALLGAVSLGSGVLLLVCGALYLLLQRRPGRLVLWLAVGGALWALLGLAAPPGSRPGLSVLLGAPIWKLPLFAAAFTGSLFSLTHWRLDQPQVLLAVPCAAGVAIWIWFGWQTWRRRFLQPDPLYWLALFLLLTVAAASLLRYRHGVEFAVAARYKLVSTLLTITAVTSLAQKLPELFARRRRLVLGGAVALWLVSGVFLYALLSHYRMVRDSTVPRTLPSFNHARAVEVLRTAACLGVFRPPRDYPELPPELHRGRPELLRAACKERGLPAP
jgi:hypothetical protein